MWVKLDHQLVSYSVGVGLLLGIFPLVVLEDTVLFPFLDVFPICLEGDVEKCVASKH